MNHLVILANIGSDLVETGKSTAKQFGVDWPHLVSQIISFCIVAALLYFFAYKRILQVLEERRQRIAEGLANADKIKAELARTEAARLEVLNQASAQANKLIEDARAAAARVQEQETQKAIAAAEQIIAKAREAAAQDHERMLAELRREVGRLVVETTSKVTGKILTPDDQKRLADETSRQLAA
ncbi:MAG TPA: F0F1 ATP synthase subunit B [Verrucomicrobiae bacterium]|jgi:F-type H+-transporting ATPase subunit b|nr:F0F1 ATP synthase subunit B [Verrucomicrobiae bacterium]